MNTATAVPSAHLGKRVVVNKPGCPSHREPGVLQGKIGSDMLLVFLLRSGKKLRVARNEILQIIK